MKSKRKTFLKRMLATGLYGRTVKEVEERLLDRQLIEILKSGELRAVEERKPR